MADSDTEPAEQDRLARLLGGLLIELGEKVRRAGVDGVHVLTDDELQSEQLRWFQEGWEEQARASRRVREQPDRPGEARTGDDVYDQDEDPPRYAPAGHPDDEQPVTPGRLLQFPQSPDGRAPHPLPIVGTGETRGKDLMPHRPRSRSRGRAGDDDEGGPPGGHPHV
ncbi:hypothetical protein ACT1U9_16380 [Streptomyces sp. BR1]|uniref:hypothetical protein n=1 Tax=Streptomyces sp. BR1 TaxID=1592323 RepID=UPI00402B9DF7